MSFVEGTGTLGRTLAGRGLQPRPKRFDHAQSKAKRSGGLNHPPRQGFANSVCLFAKASKTLPHVHYL